MINRIGHLNRILGKIEQHITLAAFVIVMLVMSAQVIMRYCFNNPITWSEEFCRYTYVWIVWLGCAAVAGEDGHTRIPVLYDKFPAKIKKILLVVTNLIIVAVLLYILPYGARYALKQHRFKSGVMRIPMSLVFWPVAVTCVLTSLQILLRTMMVIMGKEDKETC